MPFKSKAQQRFMFSQHPKIAKKWADKYGVDKDMPEKAESASHEKKEYGKTKSKSAERKKYGISNLKRK